MRYAFFDLDHTLLPFDTQALFCNHVLRREPWRILYLLVFLPVVPFAALKLVGSRTLKRIFMSYLWRMKKEKLEQHVADFVSQTVSPMDLPGVERRDRSPPPRRPHPRPLHREPRHLRPRHWSPVRVRLHLRHQNTRLRPHAPHPPGHRPQQQTLRQNHPHGRRPASSPKDSTLTIPPPSPDPTPTPIAGPTSPCSLSPNTATSSTRIRNSPPSAKRDPIKPTSPLGPTIPKPAISSPPSSKP